jgi:hypothetical protein
VDRLAGPGGAVRASLGLGSTAEDVDRLVDALRALVGRGPGWTYAVRDGRWAPEPDPRDLDPFALGRPAPTPDCGSVENDGVAAVTAS